METVLGALPSLLPKLGELLADEYKLQKEVKGGIKFLRDELESMKAALEDISNTPPDKLRSGDKIWARNVRELSYDIEDNIDTFMVQVKDHQLTKKHGFKKFIDRTLGSLMQPKIHRKIAVDIREIKNRVVEVHSRHDRYKVNQSVDKPVKVDPLALVAMVRYKNLKELVGIEESRDEVIKILIEGNEASNEQNKIVSIVGFGGLGKTTLANVVCEKLKAQFDCSAFVSVSQTPNMDRLFKDMFHQLANKDSTTSINVIIDELRGFLQKKRYLVIIDDIWEISYWETIRCALPDNSVDYKIITTTRILTVAKQIGGPYEMKPLSLENCRTLMYGRIFGQEYKDKCLDEQLKEVSNKILKKCGGVPLAIITIASLLASKGRNKLEWYDVCHSIGAGLEMNNTVDNMRENMGENMRKVLSLSYYDMPSDLRTCLLYLSMFPEDYVIRKDRLIWLWIAEGFIQSGQKEKSLFETGECYFNELINRSMIQPRQSTSSGMIKSCRVHDMVLDLIRSLSSTENFTVWNDVGQSSASEKIRRLSLQNGKACHGKPETTLTMEHVRSVIVFPSGIDHIVSTLERFRILRVLDLEGCYLSRGYSLKCLGNLLHLRYLGLRHTGIDQIPGEIVKLQFLQTLDVKGNDIPSLPSAVVQLTQLMCLRINEGARVPKGINNLTALEELSFSSNQNDLMDIIKELGHLTELKVLTIRGTNDWNEACSESLVECLNKLHKIQTLKLQIYSFELGLEALDGWVVASQHLRSLNIKGPWFSTLPAWVKVDPSLFADLSFLHINVEVLQQEDMEILGRLPALYTLGLRVGNWLRGIKGRHTIGACSFPCLVHCKLSRFGGPVVFQQGAMPRLTHLDLDFEVQGMIEIDGGFDLGLQNLPSLQHLEVHLRSGGASKEEVEEAEAAVRHAIQAHRNRPTIEDERKNGGFNVGLENGNLPSLFGSDQEVPAASRWRKQRL